MPDNYDAAVADEVTSVTDDQAMEGARMLASRGILVGISSGAAFHAALELSRRPENEGKLIVALLPDTGERYLSTGIFI